MKISKNFFLLCESTILDKSNRLTIVNLYNAVNSEKLPGDMAQFTLVANLKVGAEKKDKKLPDKINVSLVVKSPSGKNIFKFPEQAREIDKNKKEQDIGIVMSVQRLSLPEFGKYKVNLLVDDKKVADFPFEFRKKGKDK
ncbi:MAG: hypothetical protein ABIA91_01580 [Patescibacteria group bacterium]